MASEDKTVRLLFLGFSCTYRARRELECSEGACSRDRRRLLRCAQPAPSRASRRPLADLHPYVEIVLSAQSSAADRFGRVRSHLTAIINLPADPVYPCFGLHTRSFQAVAERQSGLEFKRLDMVWSPSVEPRGAHINGPRLCRCARDWVRTRSRAIQL